MNQIKAIAFDADDTLWENENYFRLSEKAFFEIVSAFASAKEAEKVLFATEMRNMEVYGYGVKAFTLSMLETALHLSNARLSGEQTAHIIALGKEQLNAPVSLLPTVEKTLAKLSEQYKLLLVTKGDLLDQERKLHKSKLEKYFDHIEIVSEKREQNYQKILHTIDLQPTEFMMVGNSLKSDVLPVLELGAWGVHIPFHTTWLHEIAEKTPQNSRFLEIEQLEDLLRCFSID